MQYNHKNRRMAKYVNGDFRLYMYDEAGHLVGDYMVTGQPIIGYVWLEDAYIIVLWLLLINTAQSWRLQRRW